MLWCKVWPVIHKSIFAWRNCISRHSFSTCTRTYMWPSMRAWTNAVGILDDPLAFKMRFSPNVESIFCILDRDDNIESIRSSPNLLPIVLRNILFKHLTHIETTHPYKVWMLDDISSLQQQMYHYPNEFLNVWKPLQENSTFQQVMDLIPEVLDSASLSANSAIEICALLKIYYTSTSNTSGVPLMRKSFNVARKHLSQAPYDIIMLFPTACNHHEATKK